MIFERTERFKRAFRKLAPEERQRFDKAIRLFQQDPRHPSLAVKKVQGAVDLWEARASLKIRFTFERIAEGIRLRNIDDHDACLRNP